MASLYLHIPFCEHKCIYCDFYSIAPKESPADYTTLVDRFLFALEKEIDLCGRDARFRERFETIFFGGGTPSLLTPLQAERILLRLRRAFEVSADAEVTLETNPGTVDVERLRAFRSAGINRISMGIQSFHDDDLKFLTRIHSAEQAKACVRDAYTAGFENVSFDLIFALPGQTLDRWKSNLEQAMQLSPTHISCYSLIVEPNTPLKRMVDAKQVTTIPPEEDAALYAFTIDYLAHHGFEQYEVSNFARPGFRSRHNSNYWNHSNYLGAGPSAHSFWSGKRWWNIANIINYCDRVDAGQLPVAGEELLSADQLADEYLFLGLRGEGLDLSRLHTEYGWDIRTEYSATIAGLVKDGLAWCSDDVLRLTPRGYALCDEICAMFR